MSQLEKWKATLPIESMTKMTSVAGGSINDAYEIDTPSKKYFLLVQPGADPSFYAAEIAGLNLFDENQVTAPSVIDSGRMDGDAYLLLSYLDEGRFGSQAELGQLIAKLHKVKQESGQFGFDHETDMVEITFDNQWTDNWYDQFMKGRIDPLYDQIKSEGHWDANQQALADQVYQIMDETLANHTSEPSLLHGDLWSGNVMFLTDGSPAIFDPAPLFGDREFDLGATLTFGGFNQDFYQAYEKAYPLEDGAWDRIEFYNLYLLLLHLVKFGSIYQGSVEQSMRKIVSSFE